MPIIRQKRITRDDLRAHPSHLYVFGDNEARIGYGGQAAAMRGEPNAIGVRTKRAPGRRPEDYWTDRRYDDCRRMIDEDLRPVFAALKSGRTIVIPEDGLGTGMSALPERAPRVFAYLTEQLQRLEMEANASAPHD
ncbi:MAG TPA: hypothetical protein VKZ79_18235 [Alphaproteobacteria bacterium]|nr:hypothetical protein [Alphaproteobacteria bacterium]